MRAVVTDIRACSVQPDRVALVLVTTVVVKSLATAVCCAHTRVVLLAIALAVLLAAVAVISIARYTGSTASRALFNALSQAQFYKWEPVRQGFPFLTRPCL